MAYSIQYGQEVKRRKRKRVPKVIPICVLLLAVLLRIFADPLLRQAQEVIWGEYQAVDVFYEVFVKDGIPG